MLHSLKQFLNQPYPDREDFPSIVKGSILAGAIVFLILAVFKPFGLHGSTYSGLLFSFYFGLISMVTAFLYEIFIKHVLKIERDNLQWTLWKWIVVVLILVICIAIANFIFTVYIFDQWNYQFVDFIKMLYSTFVVAIFPIALLGSLNVIRNLKTYKNIASNAQVKTKELVQNNRVSLPVKNSQKVFDIDVNNLLFVEAMQNYVLIHYLDENKQVRKELHRNTFISVEAVLSKEGLLKTHRSFLVNPEMIEEISGNAQGLKLRIKYAEEAIIPVSRKYVSLFR